ncbi:MAG: hypothetical protein AAF184_04770 [Pseudomonadota bacterium]
MSSAATLKPADTSVEDTPDRGWDPYRVWKERVESGPHQHAIVQQPTKAARVTALPRTSAQDTWSPYQVWMEHVARKP